MKTYQKPEVLCLPIQLVEILCASGGSTQPHVPYNPEESFDSESFIG